MDQATVLELVKLSRENEERAHRLDLLGLAAGWSSFLICVWTAYLLAKSNHDVVAGIIMGTSALSVIRRMFGK
jgi:hypothetical protein